MILGQENKRSLAYEQAGEKEEDYLSWHHAFSSATAHSIPSLMDILEKNTDSDSEAEDGKLVENTPIRKDKLSMWDDLGSLSLASEATNLGPC